MGVRGFATYIDKNREVLRDCDLSHSALVIDGNNLFYALYHCLDTGHASNGDYDAFAKHIRKFFYHLRECGVVPYVVLDGAYEPDDRKMKTVMERRKEKLHQASLVGKGYVTSCKLMPILGFETFLSALKALSVFHCMSDFEADEAMVGLANHLGAPILSNDSDFFIFPLKAGFCRLDYFDHQHVRTDGEGKKFIRAKIYDVATFCSHHPGLTPPLLPLFAALVGNDFVDASAFDNFFLNIRKPKFKRGAKGLKGNRRHCKMEGLLQWLRDVESADEALEFLLPHMKKELHPRLRQTLRKGMLGYDESAAATSSARLVKYFSSLQSDPSSPIVESCSLVDKQGHPFPSALWSSLRSGRLAPQLLNMYVNRRSFLSFQIEDMEREEAAVVAAPIRTHLYSLIDSLTSKTDSDSSKAPPTATSPSEMREFGRTLSRPRQEAVSVIPASIPLLPLLESSFEDRRLFVTSTVCGIARSPIFAPDLIADATSSSSSPPFSSFFSLYYLSLIFTVSDARCRLSRLDLATLLVTHAHCLLSLFRSYDGYRNSMVKTSSKGGDAADAGDADLVHAIASASPVELTEINQRFSRYVAEKFRNQLRLSFIHGTAQWQTVFESLTWLNRLLKSPFIDPDPALLYNGTLAATLHADLKTRGDWRKFVVDELFRGTRVGRAFLTLFDGMIESCGRLKEEVSQDDGVEGEEKRRRKKKKKKRNGSRSESGKLEVTESEEEESPTEDAGDEEEPWIDRNNKFSQLSRSVMNQ